MTLDRDTVKQHAAGRWPEILSTLGGVSLDILDGRHHPCPRCGGKDRFRFDRDKEFVICNQCFYKNNGDGFAALQWLTDQPGPEGFKSVVKQLSDYLGIANGNGASSNGHKKSNDKHIRKPSLAESIVTIKPINSASADTLLSFFCKAKPPTTLDGIEKCGGQLVRWNNYTCIRFDGHDPIGATAPTAVVLVQTSGKPFPATEKFSAHKTHNVGGSNNSWLSSSTPDEIQQAHTVLDVEGVSDLLAVASVGLLPGWVAVTNTSGAEARGKLPRPWAKGKRILVAGDADQPGQQGIESAAAAYRKAGATDIFRVALPYEITADRGKDLRDYLNEGNKIEDLPLTAWTVEQSVGEKSETEDPGRVKLLADAICQDNYFAQDAGGRLYQYKSGAYRAHGEKRIKARVKTLLGLWGDTKAWSSRLALEVVEFIRVDAPELPDRPRLDLINVENGMVRVADGVLLPHDPKYLSVVQLPVDHDPAATCLNIDAFVGSTFPTDAHDLAWEIPGVLMTPATWLQKAILLLGEGCNGKSVWLSLLVRFLGRHNVAAIPLHKLEIDKFSVSRLVGKLANICADLPSEHLAGTSTFKALTGGDTLNAEYKFKDSFDLEPFARLVFSANHPPRSADSSAAFFRRWIVIPFDHTFGPDEQIPRDVLDARLQSPGELSGMLNKALEGLRRVEKQRRFSESPSIQEAWRDFHSTTDPLAVWLDRYTIDDPEVFITKQALRVAYNAAVEREGRPSMTDMAFSLAIQKLRPNIEKKQRTVAGRMQWCFVGIGMISQDYDSQGSQPSQGSHTCYQRTREEIEGDIKGCSSSRYPNREKPVIPVSPVNCPHTDIQEFSTHDGYANRQCRDCGKWLPCTKEPTE